MRAILQRVQKGSVTVATQLQAEINGGLVVLLGVGKEDTIQQVEWLAKKTANLRIFADENGKLNLSVTDVGGEILVVSQFTLYADCRKGLRPGFDQAASPDLARQLYEEYIQHLKAEGLTVKTGIFQADMLVEIANDGPVTIILDTDKK